MNRSVRILLVDFEAIVVLQPATGEGQPVRARIWRWEGAACLGDA